MAQLIFEWPVRPSYAPDDFIISPSNAHAVETIDNWPKPGQHALLLTGAKASGKTHLVHRWLARSQGTLLDGTQLGTCSSADLCADHRFAALENIDSIDNEAALFHLLRHAETQGLHLLLTSGTAIRELPVKLPDLRSRLLALPQAGIEPPDEELLKAYLAKCFSDRQLRVGEEVITYLVRRMERSFTAAQECVSGIEQAALEARRDITIPLIKSLRA